MAKTPAKASTKRSPTLINASIRWHRRLGITLAFITIFLSVTGILLNHSPGLGLAKKQITATWLQHWYGFKPPELKGFKLGDNWITQTGENQLWFNDRQTENCPAPLMGATQLEATADMPPLMAVLCHDGLLLFTQEAELVERIDSTQLPLGTDRLTTQGQHLRLGSSTSPQQTYLFDINTLTATAISAAASHGIPEWSATEPLPATLKQMLSTEVEQPGVSLETFILDLHSGRFFGDMGVFIVDLSGIVLCFLAITGFWTWFYRYRKKATKSKA